MTSHLQLAKFLIEVNEEINEGWQLFKINAIAKRLRADLLRIGVIQILREQKPKRFITSDVFRVWHDEKSQKNK